MLRSESNWNGFTVIDIDGGTARSVSRHQLQHQQNGAIIQSNLPVKVASSQWTKTLISGLLMLSAWLANVVALSWIHERVPKEMPLPDLFFSWFPEIPWAINVAELLIAVKMLAGFWVVFRHKHRLMLIRRLLFIAGLCYWFRAVCITLLQVFLSCL